MEVSRRLHPQSKKCRFEYGSTKMVVHQLTFTAPLTKTRLLSLLILSTSCKVFDLSPRRRIWSPGTMFHHLTLSLGRAALMTGSRIPVLFNHFLGRGRRCLKFVVHGFVVAALRACRLENGADMCDVPLTDKDSRKNGSRSCDFNICEN